MYSVELPFGQSFVLGDLDGLVVESRHAMLKNAGLNIGDQQADLVVMSAYQGTSIVDGEQDLLTMRGFVLADSTGLDALDSLKEYWNNFSFGEFIVVKEIGFQKLAGLPFSALFICLMGENREYTLFSEYWCTKIQGCQLFFEWVGAPSLWKHMPTMQSALRDFKVKIS